MRHPFQINKEIIYIIIFDASKCAFILFIFIYNGLDSKARLYVHFEKLSSGLKKISFNMIFVVFSK